MSARDVCDAGFLPSLQPTKRIAVSERTPAYRPQSEICLRDVMRLGSTVRLAAADLNSRLEKLTVPLIKINWTPSYSQQ
jgi:hypothetical protein